MFIKKSKMTIQSQKLALGAKLFCFAFFAFPTKYLIFFCFMDSREFKRICRNRSFYISQVYVIEEEIKQLEIDYSIPRSPKLEVIGAPAHDHQPHIVDYISHKMRLEKELEETLKIIQMIDEIKTLNFPWGEILWKSLVNGVPVRHLCAEYDISKDMYYRRLAKFTCMIIRKKVYNNERHE